MIATEMYACEEPRLILHEGQSYVFVTHPNCVDCNDLAELALEACECGHLPDVHDEAECWNL